MEFKGIRGSARQAAPRVRHGQGEKAHDPSSGFCQEGVMGGQGAWGFLITVVKQWGLAKGQEG